VSVIGIRFEYQWEACITEMGSITEKGQRLLIVQCICIGLVGIITILRVVSRCYTMHRDRLRSRDLHWREDVLMGAAVVSESCAATFQVFELTLKVSLYRT
jgi:hypothetical protein